MIIDRKQRYVYNGINNPFYKLKSLDDKIEIPMNYSQEIISKNLTKLKDQPKGESIGGNANFWQGYSCAAGNFYFNRDIGEIERFSNYCLEDGTFGNDKFEQATFRFAISSSWQLIVEANFSLFNEQVAITQEALDNLKATAHKYNEASGFGKKNLNNKH